MINHLITSSLLLLFLLLLSVLLEKRVSPCLKYTLWLLAVIKLLIPLPAFGTHISVLNIVNQDGQGSVQQLLTGSSLHLSSNTSTQPDDEQISKKNNASRQLFEKEIQNQKNQDLAFCAPTQESSPQRGSLQEARQIYVLTALWLCGAILCGGAFLWSSLRFQRWLRRCRIFAGTCQDRLPIYKVQGLATPCLFGIFAPAIYINAEHHFDEMQLSYILAHEYTHFRHGDHLWNAVRCLCVALYWYNPLVWLAARRSQGDGELACDAGTLKRIGADNAVQYGKTLILAAQNLSQSPARRFPGFGTGAAGSLREMKRRLYLLKNTPRTRRTTLLLTTLLCALIVGCTYGGAAEYGTDQISPEHSENTQSATAQNIPAGSTVPENNTETQNSTGTKGNAETNGRIQTEANTITKTGTAANADTEAEINAGTESEAIPDPKSESVPQGSMVYHGITLYTASEPDRVCICVQPSELRKQLDYFYIPSGSAQSRLISLMEDMEPDWQKDSAHSIITKKGLKETGYTLCYQGRAYMVFEGGYLYTTDLSPENDFVEFLVRNEALCDLVQQLLSDELGYEPIDISQIHDIVSAKLDVCSIFTDWEYYSQTITDQKILALFEDWFGNAAYIQYGADCGNQNACLELTCADGSVFRLSLATDSCSNFGVNGVYYDYRPKASWDNAEFYRLFDEIPYEY